MADRGKIQIALVKLANGERLLRLTEPRSGLSLEKSLDAARPVARQKECLLGIFEAVLAKAELQPA
jgi:hypothetical protein